MFLEGRAVGRWGRRGACAVVILLSVWGWWLLLVKEVAPGSRGEIQCPACHRVYRWDPVSHAYRDSRGFGAACVRGKRGKETICACGYCLGDYDGETGAPYPDLMRRGEYFHPSNRYDQ